MKSKEIEWVPMPNCAKGYCGAGAGLSQANFKFVPKICPERGKIGLLSKSGKFKEAFELAVKIEDSCLDALTDNQKGALYSDLSLLAQKLGERLKCAHYAGKGKKVLSEATPIPCTDDANRSAENACKQSRERMKISRWIQHNAELCGIP